MGCGVYWGQVKEIERALGVMRKYGISELDAPFQALYKKRAELLAKVGFKFPRGPLQLLKLAGFSPGIISLYEDPEFGWFTMARKTPAALPVYKKVDDLTAIALLKREVTPELEERLMTPDDYLGE